MADDLKLSDEGTLRLLQAIAADGNMAEPERIAREAHFRQLDKSGRPYLEHIERVVEAVSGDDTKAVAWLHDVLEDTPILASDLLEDGISEPVVEAVQILTRGRESYAEYINRIKKSKNRMALAVKIADLFDHLRLDAAFQISDSLRDRYQKAITILLDK